jgi:hypothetical protein
MVHKMKNIFITIITYSTVVFSQSFSGPAINPFNLDAIGVSNTPTFVDINSDGDYDCFAGLGNGFTAYYQNNGTSSSPAFADWYWNAFGISDAGNNARPAFADMDGDGDYDLYLGEAGYDIYFLRNIGTIYSPNFFFVTTNPGGIANLGPNVAPALVDIDDDGDYDLFTGEGFGNIYYYKNLGTAFNAIFSVAFTNPFGLSDVGFSSSPAFTDIDFDGDYDAFIGNQNGDIIFFRNNGTKTAPSFGIGVTNPFGISNVGSNAAPYFVDINGDGKEDLFVGSGNGDTYYFLNTTVVSVEDVQNSSFVELKAYPNPVGNTLNISSKNVDLNNAELSVYSILGEKLNLNSTRSGSIASINFTNLAPGIYILVIQSDVVNYSTKIIKGLRGF